MSNSYSNVVNTFGPIISTKTNVFGDIFFGRALLSYVKRCIMTPKFKEDRPINILMYQILLKCYSIELLRCSYNLILILTLNYTLNFILTHSVKKVYQLIDHLHEI